MGDNGNKGPPGLQGKNGDDGKTGIINKIIFDN